MAEPIESHKGKKLVTLRDATHYITKLPKTEHDAEEWQAAMRVLLQVADHDGPEKRPQDPREANILGWIA